MCIIQVKELGFCGALVDGFSQVGDADSVVYYDLPQYRPFWATVQQLDVPFYLHPRLPLARREQGATNRYTPRAREGRPGSGRHERRWPPAIARIDGAHAGLTGTIGFAAAIQFAWRPVRSGDGVVDPGGRRVAARSGGRQARSRKPS